MEKNAKIYVAGHSGMVGKALCLKLEKEGYTNLIYRTSKELDLRNQKDVEDFFEKEKPEYIYILAAKVGGIFANIEFPADFIYDNLLIQSNIINSAYKNNAKKLLFVGSSCIYPTECLQPIKEEYLLSGKLEPTNESYAIAKIAGIKMCQAYNKQYGANFISLMPTNIYGPNDNFDLKTSHVMSALIRRFHEAKQNGEKEVVVFGTGNVYREFLFVDDLANAIYYFMKNYNDSEFVNVGTGKDISIKDLANTIKNIIGFEGNIVFDKTKPDGMAKKQLDVSMAEKLGWKAEVSLKDGISKTYNWFLQNKI